MCSIIADFTAAMMEPVEITEPAKHDVRYQRCTYLISTLKKRPSECNESKYWGMKLLVFCLLLHQLAAEVYKNEQCQRRTDEQIIWEYDVTRSYRIGAYQEVEAEYGPTGVTITCIGVDSLSDENNGAMWVTSGGIGHNFIKIKFRSKYSRGLRYRVYVYGKPHSNDNFNSF